MEARYFEEREGEGGQGEAYWTEIRSKKKKWDAWVAMVIFSFLFFFFVEGGGVINRST